jgi:hypothetical protein
MTGADLMEEITAGEAIQGEIESILRATRSMDTDIKAFLDEINSVIDMFKPDSSVLKLVKALIEVYSIFNRAILRFPKHEPSLFKIAEAFLGLRQGLVTLRSVFPKSGDTGKICRNKGIRAFDAKFKDSRTFIGHFVHLPGSLVSLWEDFWTNILTTLPSDDPARGVCRRALMEFRAFAEEEKFGQNAKTYHKQIEVVRQKGKLSDAQLSALARVYSCVQIEIVNNKLAEPGFTPALFFLCESSVLIFRTNEKVVQECPLEETRICESIVFRPTRRAMELLTTRFSFAFEFVDRSEVPSFFAIWKCFGPDWATDFSLFQPVQLVMNQPSDSGIEWVTVEEA